MPDGAWLRGRSTASLMIALNGVIVAVVIILVGLHLSSQRSSQLNALGQGVSNLVQEQSRQISALVERYEHVLGQLENRLNVIRQLENSSADNVKDYLRQFRSLVPGSVDLLLLQANDQVLAASTFIASEQPLASYCEDLQRDRAQVERAGVHVYRGARSGRCPPTGTLIYARPLAPVGGRPGETIWILLEPSSFQLIFDQEIKTLGAPAHFRVYGRDRQIVLSEGWAGPPDAIGALDRDPPVRQLMEQNGQNSSRWSSPQTGQLLLGASGNVKGTPLELGLVVDASELLRLQWQPYAYSMGGLALLFLLLWGSVSYYILRMLQGHQRILRASEARFDRSLDYANVGVWEWNIATGEVHWTRRVAPMFGYTDSLEKVNYASFVSCVHPDDREKVEAAVRVCLEQNQTYAIDHRVVWADGSIHTLRESGNVLRSAGGTPQSMFGVVQDITDITETAQQLQAILDNVHDAIITVDSQGVISSFNLAATRIFGYQASEAIGQKVKRLMPELESLAHDNAEHHDQTASELRVIGMGRELIGRHASGRTFPIHLAVSTIEHDGQPMGIGLIRDITESKRAEAEIQRLAYSDQLTGLPNRRLLLDRLERALIASQRHRHCGALIFIDIDNFKSLNDSQGHEAGDLLLQRMAHRLTQAVRECDTVARLGGDEFVALLENLDKEREAAAAHAETVAIKLTQAFAQPFLLKGKECFVTASIGIAMFDAQSGNVEAMMGQADMAMYQAKADGRNAFRFFETELQTALVARAALEQDMRQGLLRQEFFLVYQPQFDDSLRVIGVESLVRWRSPKHGDVPPGEFITLAEQNGFIIELGGWVLQSACQQLQAWSRQPGMESITMSVNVSAAEFRHVRFLDQVISAIEAAGVDPAKLQLELTESALADDVGKLASKMSTLKGLGLSFSLDDFGTGYSSLSYLKRLPLDQLKIDRSFVIDVHDDPNSAAIARTIVALGQSLGLTVIAEGVETELQLEGLRRCGCHNFQGYHFSRPLTVEQFETFMAKRSET